MLRWSRRRSIWRLSADHLNRLEQTAYLLRRARGGF
jgi:hypothetical protein